MTESKEEKNSENTRVFYNIKSPYIILIAASTYDKSELKESYNNLPKKHHAGIIEELNEDVDKSKHVDSLIFVYSGHGLSNGILPTDARKINNSINAYPYEQIFAVFNSAIYAPLRDMIKLYAIDSCRTSIVSSNHMGGPSLVLAGKNEVRWFGTLNNSQSFEAEKSDGTIMGNALCQVFRSNAKNGFSYSLQGDMAPKVQTIAKTQVPQLINQTTFNGIYFRKHGSKLPRVHKESSQQTEPENNNSKQSKKGGPISVENIRAAVMKVVKVKEPSKVGTVDRLMRDWKGREAELYTTLMNAYGMQNYKKLKPRSLYATYAIGSIVESVGSLVLRRLKRRSDGKIFSLQIINKEKLNDDDLSMLDTQLSIMRQIDHSNIVSLLDIFDSRLKMCLVLDDMVGGTLLNRIINNYKGHFAEKMASHSFGQILSALEYLHSKKIVHRNIKPESFLFVSIASESDLKLVDFSMAASCKEKLLTTPCGSPNYIAPEILNRQSYDTQVDMWSAGAVLYYMLCGFNIKRLNHKIDMPSPHWDNISQLATQLVASLLISNPKRRLTAKQALKHDWLNKH